MGETDIKRQELNVFKIGVLGAKVIPVTSGTATLKDALNESIRDWVTNVDDTHYIIGSVTGPHPYLKLLETLMRLQGKNLKTNALINLTVFLIKLLHVLGVVQMQWESFIHL